MTTKNKQYYKQFKSYFDIPLNHDFPKKLIKYKDFKIHSDYFRADRQPITKKQVKEKHEWYVDNLDNFVIELEKILPFKLDYTVKSIIQLENWFYANAFIEEDGFIDTNSMILGVYISCYLYKILLIENKNSTLIPELYEKKYSYGRTCWQKNTYKQGVIDFDMIVYSCLGDHLKNQDLSFLGYFSSYKNNHILYQYVRANVQLINPSDFKNLDDYHVALDNLYINFIRSHK
jgi:hypothetical protein